MNEMLFKFMYYLIYNKNILKLQFYFCFFAYNDENIYLL